MVKSRPVIVSVSVSVYFMTVWPRFATTILKFFEFTTATNPVIEDVIEYSTGFGQPTVSEFVKSATLIVWFPSWTADLKVLFEVSTDCEVPIVSHGCGITMVASQSVARKRSGFWKVTVKVSVKMLAPSEPVISILATLVCPRFDESTEIVFPSTFTKPGSPLSHETR